MLVLIVGGGASNNTGAPVSTSRKRLQRRKDERDDIVQEDDEDQCPCVNRKTREQCQELGVPKLCGYCPAHFKERVLKPLKSNNTIAKYRRAKETLERFHRREKRRREEEVAQEEADNLERRGFGAADLNFDDSLSDASDVEEVYGDRVVALLPPRARMPAPNRPEPMDEDDDVVIMDDSAEEAAQPAQRARAPSPSRATPLPRQPPPQHVQQDSSNNNSSSGLTPTIAATAIHDSPKNNESSEGLDAMDVELLGNL